MKRRIWELDALRGVCILAMVVIHLVYNLTALYRVTDWVYPRWFEVLMQWGGVVFILLSGICVTLGSHPVRRGLIVFAGGLAYTAATAGMYLLGMADFGFIIWFGVLHCLGVCMLLWPLFSRLPAWTLAVLGLALAAIGLGLQRITVDFPWLIPLGVVQRGFVTPDYFPLVFNLGWFLGGAFLGKTVYRKKQSLLPGTAAESLPARALCWCGRQSLFIYLLHQPVLVVLVELYLLCSGKK